MLIFFILVCYGLTQILVAGSIFNKIRPKHSFFHCSMCMGFWVGILISIVFLLNGAALPLLNWYTVVLYGLLSSGTSYIINRLIDDDGFRITHN